MNSWPGATPSPASAVHSRCFGLVDPLDVRAALTDAYVCRHIYAVKRTTIFFEEQTLRRLQRAAQRQGVSSATLVREAVSRYLDAPQVKTGLPSVTGQFASTHRDTAERADELLWRDPHA